MPTECKTTLISSPDTSSLPPPCSCRLSIRLTGVTCRHQLPIRQCNIRPILPACDWEILEWSKPTNLIYRASINKEIVPSLIALLNNGCLFGNHFPISHHFPLHWPSRVLFFISFLSCSFFLSLMRFSFAAVNWICLKQWWQYSCTWHTSHLLSDPKNLGTWLSLVMLRWQHHYWEGGCNCCLSDSSGYCSNAAAGADYANFWPDK